MPITIGIKNFGKPSPAFYRQGKKFIYLLTAGGVLTGTFKRFGVSAEDTALIMAWLGIIGEAFGGLLGGDKEYAPKGATEKALILEKIAFGTDVGGGTVGTPKPPIPPKP